MSRDVKNCFTNMVGNTLLLKYSVLKVAVITKFDVKSERLVQHWLYVGLFGKLEELS